jgi:hypothetical protein
MNRSNKVAIFAAWKVESEPNKSLKDFYRAPLAGLDKKG